MKSPYRIGLGYDVHALVPNRPLVLGGVTLAHDRGLLGHSDADCLLHALCDALLGALALGDIGHHFPNTDPAWAGADSRVLLRHCLSLVRQRGWQPVNVDCMVIAEAPKLKPHLPAMRARVAQDLGLEADDISIKATTHEGLGSLGRAEGIAAQAVVLLMRIEPS